MKRIIQCDWWPKNKKTKKMIALETVSRVMIIERSLNVLLIFITPLPLQQLWISPVHFDFLFHAKFLLLTKLLASDMYPSFTLSIVLFKFFSRTVFPSFLLTKPTIVVFLGLPIRWHSSISIVLILTLFWLKTSVKFSSNWSSEIQSVILCLSRLLRLLYWSYLLRTVFNTEIRLSHFSIFWWGNGFSSRSTSMMDSLTLERLEATKSYNFFLKKTWFNRH